MQRHTWQLAKGNASRSVIDWQFVEGTRAPGGMILDCASTGEIKVDNQSFGPNPDDWPGGHYGGCIKLEGGGCPECNAMALYYVNHERTIDGKKERLEIEETTRCRCMHETEETETFYAYPKAAAQAKKQPVAKGGGKRAAAARSSTKDGGSKRKKR